MKYRVETYYQKADLPVLEEVAFFHFASSFDWYSQSPTYTPLMVVAFDGDKPVAAMFANITRINRFFRGKLFKRCFISQQPAFFDDSRSKIDVFEALITHLVKEVRSKVFLIRYENLGDAIFGYKGFRENKF